jgi:hypothetical protein
MFDRHAARIAGCLARTANLAAAITVALSPACAPSRPKPLRPVTRWQQYRTEDGGYSMDAPAGWKVVTHSTLGGFETTVRANDDNWIALSKRILPGELEAKILRADTRDQAIIEAVQARYHALKPRFERFVGEAPQLSPSGAMIGFGRFTATTKAGYGRQPTEVQGATALVIGLNNLYIFDAFADPKSAQVIGAVFDRMVATFKFDE